MNHSSQGSHELRDLRPGRWGRAKALIRKWDRKLFASDLFFSFGLVGLVFLILNKTWTLSQVGQGLLWGLALSALVLLLNAQFPGVLARGKDNVVSMLLLLTSLAAFKLVLIFQLDIVAPYLGEIPASFYIFLIPMAAAAMILRLLTTMRQTLLFSAIYALCLGLFLGKASLIGVHTFVVSIMGALFIAQATTRSTFHLAGLKTALVSGLSGAFVAFSWMGQLPAIDGADPRILAQNFSMPNVAMWCFFGGAFGGWLSSVFALSITPLIETLLDYTTDLKLLELARMDHPLLRELVMKAPGTYHHSIIVGSLCEAAAESVGANALLCRVAAYYHDIGKIGRADYFVENQTRGINPHDQMKPHLSAKIIIAHVKEGRRLAKEYKLGDAITDFILQHHGRSLVSYFYNKAKQEAAQPDSGVDPDSIAEEDFRYPGPNPQSKETAIMALADSCEAATRSLVDPTPARIEAMVQKLINKALAEGLLDEADITLRELRLVSKAFLRILLGLHHSRIQYPNQEEGLPTFLSSAPNVTSIKVKNISSS